MARLFSSGAEYSDALDGGIWDASNGAVTSAAGSARSGLRGFRFNPSASAQNIGKQFIATGGSTNHYLRAYLNVQTAPSATNRIVQSEIGFNSGLLFGYSVRLTNGSLLQLFDEVSDTQLGNSSSALTASTWYRLELAYVDSTRAITAYLDGVQWATGNVNVTAVLAEGIWVGLGLFVPAVGLETSTGEIWMDDLALNDASGSQQTGLPGAGGIVMALPNAAGDNSNGIRGGTDSGSDYGQLDENPPNNITDYYIFDHQNDILDLGIEDQSTNPYLTAGSTITLVQVNARHRVDAGTQSRTYRLRIKSQAFGAVASGPTVSHNDIIWKTNGDVLPKLPFISYTDPQVGGSWTVPLLDSAQIGYTLTSAVAALWITVLWALIEFVAPTEVLVDPILTGGVIPFPR